MTEVSLSQFRLFFNHSLKLGVLIEIVCLILWQYWVSQGNKWCDFCKIFISNNPSSIRNHEMGTRHKEAVGKRLDDVRKKNVEKEKADKAALKALEQIEAVSIYFVYFTY